MFHDDLLPDAAKVPVLEDPDREGVLMFGPTESARVAKMRATLNNLNYAQVRASRGVKSGVSVEFCKGAR